MSPREFSARASVLADLLAQGRIIHAGSMLATFVGLLGLAAAAFSPGAASGVIVIAAACVVLLGLIETYFAVRVGFDRALFDRVGQGLSLDTLDASLASLGLIGNDKQGASFIQRQQGCMRLLVWQAAVILAQYVVIVVGAACAVV